MDAATLSLYVAVTVAAGSGIGVPILFRRRDRRERASERAAAEKEEGRARDVVTTQGLMADIQDERNDLRKQLQDIRVELDQIDIRWRARIREVEDAADRADRESRRRIAALEAEVYALRRRLGESE